MLLEDRILKKWLLPFILSVLIAVDSMAQCIPVYKDSSMSVERRVTDLLGRMTLREKIAQLSHCMVINYTMVKRWITKN